MRYIPITCAQREHMLATVGVTGIGELFADVPAQAVLQGLLDLPEPLSEVDLVRHVRGLANQNVPATELVSFAGAGMYDHHIPSVVDHILRRPEFFTAYTPYQPEVSQGTLQGIYEYQSMVCELTGMDVANASMYDGATAFVEAALMACRITRRSRVVVSGTVHPEWIETLETYAASGLLEVVGDECTGGLSDASSLASLVDDRTAAVLVASPNFVGNIEDLAAIGAVARAAGALFVVASNPIMLGVLEPPSTFGADIVVGEGQPLGSPMSLGGPGLGLFACRESHVRQMPGRLVGRTVDIDGNHAFVLTLSTREQHIRREKATSNICSNHALNALAAGAYLCAVGAEGLVGIARSCVAKAHYLRDALLSTGRFSAPWGTPFGYEFALAYEGDASEMHDEMLARGYLAGVVVEAPEGGDLVVFAVTEKRTRGEIDAFVKEVASL
ncbi:MAG: aminomethyl-transferring glycine dehydrogenase subunit GcvPA [Coriobacteriia bacterium]|nr:aminomethyl-transferring glycine dehydrogenase subunit GcvPA [Coriobacteriia bacterium]